MKIRSSGYDHSTTRIKSYSADPRSGQPDYDSARSDPRVKAADQARSAHGDAGYKEMTLDVANRNAARRTAMERQEQTKGKVRGRH